MTPAAPSSPSIDALPRRRGRPRAMPVEQRREALLDAAQALMLERGIAGVSVDDIAAASHMAKGTFYLYYASKDALLAALQQRFIRVFCDLMITAMKPTSESTAWPQRLDAGIAAVVQAYVRDIALHDLVFHEYKAQGEHTLHDNPCVRLLEQSLREGQAQGCWQLRAPYSDAVMLFNAMHGAMDDALGRHSHGARAARQSLSPEELADLVRSIQHFFARVLGVAG